MALATKMEEKNKTEQIEQSEQEEFTRLFLRALQDERVQQLLAAAFSSEICVDDTRANHEEENEKCDDDVQSNRESNSQVSSVATSDETQFYPSVPMASKSKPAEEEVAIPQQKPVKNSVCPRTVPHYKAHCVSERYITYRKAVTSRKMAKLRTEEQMCSAVGVIQKLQRLGQNIHVDVIQREHSVSEGQILHLVKDRGKHKSVTKMSL
jgi:hypothetical protein